MGERKIAAMPGGHAHDDQQATVGDRPIGRVRIPGADPRSRQRDGALATRRSARSDRDRRGHQLDRRDARAQRAFLAVEGLDHGVGAMAFGLGREPLHEEPDTETTERGGQGEEPESVGPDDLPERAAFVRQSRRLILRQDGEEEPGRAAQQQREDLGRGGARDAEQRGVDDELALAPQPRLARPGRGRYSSEKKNRALRSPASMATTSRSTTRRISRSSRAGMALSAWSRRPCAASGASAAMLAPRRVNST